MSIAFENLLWLLVIPAAVPLLALGYRWFRSMSAARRWSAVALRAVLIALVAAMLAGASSVRIVDRVAVVALIDVSGSVRRFASPPEGGPGAVETARRFIQEAARRRGPDDLVGVVVFDGRALAVAAPTRADISDRSIDVAMSEGTDIAAAIRYGAALLPPDAAGRLVLISDGNQTSGDALGAARAVARRGPAGALPIDVVPLAYTVREEVIVESVDLPPRAPAESAVTVRIVLAATDAASGMLYLLREGEPIDISPDDPARPGRRIVLEPGRRVEQVQVDLPPGKIHRFEAVFEPDRIVRPDGATVLAGDTRPENNRATAFTITPGKGAVLVLDGVGAGESTLARTLREAGIDATSAPASALPPDLLALQAYDLIILENIPADSLGRDDHERLASFVRDLGGGLVMVGGPDSFGAGGWQNTPVEPILPVRLDLPEQLVQPDAAIVFVLDNSGSMSNRVSGSIHTQQEIANEAAALAVRSLPKSDLVAVIEFNHEHRVLAPLGENKDPDRTAERILSINPGGGTVLGPAMAEAGRQLRAKQARVKYMIILSDGVSQDHQTLPELSRRLWEREQVHVTTVAVGDMADHETMRIMAEAGGGAFYAVTNPGMLPRLFLHAVRIKRTPLIREGQFQPVVLPSGSPLVAGLGAPPPLDGLVLSQRRDEPGITYAMAAPGGEPLLAHWNVELGQVVAFTSDAHRWARRWLDWPGYRQMWTRIARLTARPPTDNRVELTTHVSGDTLRIRMDAVDASARPLELLSVPAVVYPPGGRPVEIELVQTGPGLYEGRAPAPVAGDYVVVAKPRLGSRAQPPVIGGVSVAGGAEYRALRSDIALLRRIAEETGGQLIDPSSAGSMASLYERPSGQLARARSPLWRTLLIWAVLVLLLDIGTRRVAWDRFVSRQFGADLKQRAAETVRDRSEQAARALSSLRGRERRSALAGAPVLSEEDARKIELAEAQRRREVYAASLRAARAARAASSAGAAGEAEPPEPAVRSDGGPGAAAPEETEDSPLLAAKRRARERMERDEQDGPGAQPA